MNELESFWVPVRDVTPFVKEDKASLVRGHPQFDVAVGLYHLQILEVKFSLNPPVFGIGKSPSLNPWAVDDQDLSVVDSFNQNSAFLISAKIMNEPWNLKTGNIILDGVTSPEFEGLDFNVLVRILVGEFFKSYQVFTVWSETKALYISWYTLMFLVTLRDEIPWFDLYCLHSSLIDIIDLHFILMSHDNIASLNYDTLRCLQLHTFNVSLCLVII